MNKLKTKNENTIADKNKLDENRFKYSNDPIIDSLEFNKIVEGMEKEMVQDKSDNWSRNSIFKDSLDEQ